MGIYLLMDYCDVRKIGDWILMGRKLLDFNQISKPIKSSSRLMIKSRALWVIWLRLDNYTHSNLIKYNAEQKYFKIEGMQGSW